MSIYYDSPVASAGGRASTADRLIGSEVVTSRGAGYTSTLTQGISFDSPGARGAARGLSRDGQVWTESPVAKGAGRASGKDWATSFDRPTPVKGAGRSSNADVYGVAEVIRAKGAGKASSVTQIVSSDAPSVKGAGRAVGQPTAVYLDTIAARGAGRSIGTDLIIGTDRPVTRGAGRGATADAKVMQDAPVAKAGGRTTVTTQQIGAAEVVRVRGAAKGSTCTAFQVRPDALIEAVRLTAQQVFGSSVTRIVEGLPPAEFVTDITLPFVAIVAGDGALDETWAVNQEVWRLPVDLVHVSKTAGDGVTDSSQSTRKILGSLMDALRADYKLRGLVLKTDILRLPMNKVNAYQQRFSQEGQPVTVLASGVQFTYVGDLVC